MQKITHSTKTRKSTVYTVSETRIRKATRQEAQSLPTPGKSLVFTYEPDYQPLIIHGFEC